MGLSIILSLGLLLIQSEYPAPKLERDFSSFQRAFQEAVSLRSQGEFKQAYQALMRALDISRQNNDVSQQRKCLLRLAILKWDLGIISESSAYFNAARAAFKRAGDKRSEEYCQKCLKIIELYNRGKADRDSKRNYLSLGRFNEAIVLGRETGLLNFELKCIRQKGLAFWELGELGLFLQSNERGLELASLINNKYEKGKCLNNMGAYFQTQNNLSLAISYFDKALSITKIIDDQPTEAECLSNLGITYRVLGNFSKALFYLNKALELDRIVGDANTISTDLDNIGAIYLRRSVDSRNKQDLLEALNAFRECLSIRSSKKNVTSIQLSALNNIGIIKSELKEYSSARKYFYSAINTSDEEQYVSEKSNIINNIAASYFYEDKIAEAILNYRKALEIGSKYALEKSVIESCLGLGQCYDVLGEYASALSFYKRSIEATESVRDRISNEYLMIGFARNKMSAYRRVIDILVDKYIACPSIGILEEIFCYIERAKARAFLDNINNRAQNQKNGGTEIANEYGREISKRISELSRELISIDIREERRVRIGKELENEEERYYRLLAETNKGLRDKKQSVPKLVCTIAQVQNQLLNNKSALLQYYVGDSKSYLIIVSKDDAKLFILASRVNIEKSLKAYLKMVSSESINAGAGITAAKRIAKELLPEEEIQQSHGINTLIIVPHEILHYLPFEAICLSSAPGPIFVIERFVVSYCPSASSMLALKELPVRDPWKKDLLALGSPDYIDVVKSNSQNVMQGKYTQWQLYNEQGFRFLPLPFSKKEVFEITKVFKMSRIDALIGKNARESTIKTMNLSDYRIIHFACHAFVDNRYPLRSALVLAMSNQQEEDGYLEMREIINLEMNADLVVLSACQTGNGNLERAEGPMGLVRSFIYAGARSVIASLWSINDKPTVILMKYLYRYLVEGYSASRALQLAKIGMIHSPWSNPFFWAGFLLTGDPDAVSIVK